MYIFAQIKSVKCIHHHCWHRWCVCVLQMLVRKIQTNWTLLKYSIANFRRSQSNPTQIGPENMHIDCIAHETPGPRTPMLRMEIIFIYFLSFFLSFLSSKQSILLPRKRKPMQNPYGLQLKSNGSIYYKNQNWNYVIE